MTGLLWKGALEAFSWYVGDMSRFTRINGSIAVVVVFLVWVYVQAVILLYGVRVHCGVRAATARTIASLNTRTSSGLRDVMRLPSSTTGLST